MAKNRELSLPKSRTKRRATFILLALLWLPLGLILLTAARGFSLPIDQQAWLSLVGVAPFGLPLALACRGLRRIGHRVAAWRTFIVFAPVTVLSVLTGGLFGPLGIAAYAVVASFPAWAIYAFFRYRSKRQSA